MLNLFSLKESNNILSHNNSSNKSNHNKTSKHFPSPLREWKNSIYVYNKKGLNLIPCSTTSVNNIIKSYFNFYNENIEAKMRKKRLLLRLKRFSSNKLYISNGGFKHTNNKVLINLYIFNRQKINYLLCLKKWYIKNLLKKTTEQRDINIKLIKRLKIINKKGIQAVKTINKNKYLLIKALNSVLKSNKFNINSFTELSKYTENFYKNLLRKSLKKVIMYFYYKQLLYINKSKLNYTYLQFLKKSLEKIYLKNVEFNLINLKHFYLNSDILSESITNKLARNRIKMAKYMSSLKNKVQVKKKSLLNNTLNKGVNQNLFESGFLLQSYIINNLKYKHVSGFRLEAKGRLNKRFTASRSISKVRYKGNLLDIDSSYKSLSTVLLKGNLKSNIQYTKLASQTRIGSFGIKGWISGN